jgi:hypothetical protein
MSSLFVQNAHIMRAIRKGFHAVAIEQLQHELAALCAA